MRLVSLHLNGSGLAIEDFVEASLLTEAVALESAGRHGTGHAFRANQLPRKGRSAWIDNWFVQQGLETLSKAEVASRVLDITDSRLMCEPGRQDLLKEVHSKLRRALSVEG